MSFLKEKILKLESFISVNVALSGCWPSLCRSLFLSPRLAKVREVAAGASSHISKDADGHTGRQADQGERRRHLGDESAASSRSFGCLIFSNPPHKASKVQPCITHKWRKRAVEGLLAPPPSRSRAVGCGRPEGREVKAGWEGGGPG